MAVLQAEQLPTILKHEAETISDQARAHAGKLDWVIDTVIPSLSEAVK